MYNYNDVKSIHLELTSNCQARCPMCPRRINGGVMNPLLQVNDIDLNTFKQWFPSEFIKQLDSLFMCGNFGDPIIGKDCLEIFTYLKEVNPNIITSMHTNGSARDKQWWKQIASVCDRVVFGIDGLDDTHSRYRINTDFNKIIENAKTYIDNGGNAEWHMLVFEHNEHQITDCELLSKELKFKSFQIKHTSRFVDDKFNVLDDSGKTIDILYPTTKSKNMIPLVQSYKNEIKPEIKCKAQKGKQIYVSATGTVSPCCWLDFEYILHKQDTRIDYMDKIDMLPNLNNQSLIEIFDSDFFNKIKNTWENDPLKECSKQCGTFDRLSNQFVTTEKS